MNIESIAWPQFLQLISDRSIDINFVSKVENSQSFTKEIVALANNKGGRVVIGFDKNNYQLPGVRFDKRWLWAVVKNECKPEPECVVKELIRNMRRVYVIEVAEGTQKPYSIFSVSFAQEEQQNISSAVQQVTAESQVLDQLQNESIRKRHKKCLEFLKNNDGITNAQYRTINAVSHKTAHNELSYLVKSGLLKSVGQGRSTKYVLAGSEVSDLHEKDNSNVIDNDHSAESNSIEIHEDNDSNIDNTIDNHESELNITNNNEKADDCNDEAEVEPANNSEINLNSDIIRLKEFIPEKQPSLFDLEQQDNDINTISKTDIRKTFDSEHMDLHVNNDIFDDNFELDEIKIEEPNTYF